MRPWQICIGAFAVPDGASDDAKLRLDYWRILNTASHVASHRSGVASQLVGNDPQWFGTVATTWSLPACYGDGLTRCGVRETSDVGLSKPPLLRSRGGYSA